MGHPHPEPPPLVPICFELDFVGSDYEPGECENSPCASVCSTNFGIWFYWIPQSPRHIYGVYFLTNCWCEEFFEGEFYVYTYHCLYCWVGDCDWHDGPDVREAGILSNQQAWLPSDTMLWEPDRHPTAETRTMVLADWKDASNILIKYKPAELV
jgi:hypothetical protein